jgi:hypothetical protein
MAQAAAGESKFAAEFARKGRGAETACRDWMIVMGLMLWLMLMITIYYYELVSLLLYIYICMFLLFTTIMLSSLFLFDIICLFAGEYEHSETLIVASGCWFSMFTVFIP